jgi:hypothetical protein
MVMALMIMVTPWTMYPLPHLYLPLLSYLNIRAWLLNCTTCRYVSNYNGYLGKNRVGMKDTVYIVPLSFITVICLTWNTYYFVIWFRNHNNSMDFLTIPPPIPTTTTITTAWTGAPQVSMNKPPPWINSVHLKR